jgi:hypothetical protein
MERSGMVQEWNKAQLKHFSLRECKNLWTVWTTGQNALKSTMFVSKLTIKMPLIFYVHSYIYIVLTWSPFKLEEVEVCVKALTSGCILLKVSTFITIEGPERAKMQRRGSQF